jgi:4-carboxymuconolactone decarboxylase
MSDKRFEQGVRIRRDMFGPAGAEQQIDAASAFMWPMQEFVTDTCFGDVWHRDHLDRRQRSLLTLGMLLAMGKIPEIKVHVKGALANGATIEEIREVFVHGMIYCGVPAAVGAFRAASEVFAELGVDEGPHPDGPKAGDVA